jgi:nitroreductase
MKFIDLVKSRYSVRTYLPRKIEDEKLQLILEAGRVAPTACNNQPQRTDEVSAEPKTFTGRSRAGKR